jgi:hypothetical protein
VKWEKTPKNCGCLCGGVDGGDLEGRREMAREASYCGHWLEMQKVERFHQHDVI